MSRFTFCDALLILAVCCLEGTWIFRTAAARKTVGLPGPSAARKSRQIIRAVRRLQEPQYTAPS